MNSEIFCFMNLEPRISFSSQQTI